MFHLGWGRSRRILEETYSQFFCSVDHLIKKVLISRNGLAYRDSESTYTNFFIRLKHREKL